MVSSLSVVPPLSMSNLETVADELINQYHIDTAYRGWMMVEIHNQVWKDTIASIPFDRRILLLPKCLSNSGKCQAEIDDLGLLCHRCGHCPIPDLQEKADELGVMSIVAEGFTSVVGLIQNGVVDAVIGVSCLNSLEKAFPLLIRNAVPGIAVPLNYDGCKDTQVDYGYVMQLMSMRSDKDATFMDYDGLRAQSKAWFEKDALKEFFPESADYTSIAALDWLSGDGKRWRPYLVAAVYTALTNEDRASDDVRRAAIAVECFHKASLVHDDIQDNDDERYGKPTIHKVYGVPLAINVGDYLLGQGYRILGGCESKGLIAAIAEAHVALCKGQGLELDWSKAPQPLTLDFVLDIFCNKTVPAFEVSLMLGLICAGDDKELRQVFHAYSKALGIAYQLLDDIQDFDNDEPIEIRPSAVLALVCEQHPDKDFLQQLFATQNMKEFFSQPGNKAILDEALEKARALAEDYHQQALAALANVKQVELKRLLFRITERIIG
ncbi:MAG: polyprenyl synthetase family protein [Bacteroidaceae bacterium]|nr:polyprenyl synthetase family protein [Bacteroidaceae bacterium]